MTKLLPVLMILQSLGAAGVYAYAGNLRQAIYWSAAAIITASVTF